MCGGQHGFDLREWLDAERLIGDRADGLARLESSLYEY
jgi:hypothetical protein